MKRLGYKYHLVSIMMIISLICIGFSTWNITNQVVESQLLAGSIKADNVINSSEYIDFDTSADADETKDGMEVFDYCADGFIVENTISKTATLKAHFKIDLTHCKETFSDYASLQAVITLRGTNGGNAMAVFTGLTGTTVNASILSDGAIATSGTSNKTSQLYTYTITFANILDSELTEYAFSVVYTFNVEYYSSFYTQINDSPEFFIGARITGVN